jgi:hypothetical protein
LQTKRARKQQPISEADLSFLAAAFRDPNGSTSSTAPSCSDAATFFSDNDETVLVDAKSVSKIGKNGSGAVKRPRVNTYDVEDNMIRNLKKEKKTTSVSK